MRASLVIPVLLSFALAGCGTTNRLTAPPIDFDEYPPQMPERIVTDLDSEARGNLRQALVAVDRLLGEACTPAERAQIKEGLIIFGWITAATRPNLTVQTYVNARAPELRRAREALSPGCSAALDTALDRIRDTRA